MDDGSQASSVLLGQIVVVAGAASGVGLAIAQRAKAAGAQLIITDRDAGRLEEAADEIGVEATAAIDADDPEQIGLFLTGLPTPVDHALIMISAPHAPPLGVIDVAQARSGLERLLVPISVARFAIQGMGAGGSLVFVSGMGGRRPHIGPSDPGGSIARPDRGSCRRDCPGSGQPHRHDHTGPGLTRSRRGRSCS